MENITNNLTWLSTDVTAVSLFLLGLLLRRVYNRNRRATALTGILGFGLLLSGIGMAVGPRIKVGVGEMLEKPEAIELVYLESASAERIYLNAFVVATADYLNIRSGPGEEWDVLGQVDQGARLPCTYCIGPTTEIAGRRGRWCQVFNRNRSKKGYVWGVYLQKTGDPIDDALMISD